MNAPELLPAFVEHDIESSDLSQNQGKKNPAYVENCDESSVEDNDELPQPKNKTQILTNNNPDDGIMKKRQRNQLQQQSDNVLVSEETDKTNLLMVDDFNYSIIILDSKLNSLYKLCRFFGDQQQQFSKDL
ncbi:18764_t:CDS:2 [Racocetra fulgida]|uniref:18764_t:CDS:1 n=1 Tax=Racocetra fulgida TaxID=60492 RepID=A0A9N9NEG0_9GLOM|nr:18764_t:CDS:2 [Racocetra fulgida]